MGYHYTVQSGYDRGVKKKVERGTLFAVPLTVLAIIGISALSSSTTIFPGGGNEGISSGTGGTPSVAKEFKSTSGQGSDPATGDGSQSAGGSQSSQGVSTQRTASASSPTSSGGSTGSGGTAGAIQPSAPSGGGSTPPSGGSGGGGGDCACQALQPVTAIVEPVLQPVTQALPSLGL